jgi:hypothetical protein
MRCESQDMTVIPLEVFVPQVFPPGSSRPSSVPTPSTCFPLSFAWCGGGSVVGILHGHKFSSGPKVGVPEINSRVDGTALAASRSKADQPHLIGHKSWHSPVPRSDLSTACTIAISGE